MTHIPRVLHALERLLGYPDEQTVSAAELLFVVLHDELESGAREMADFGAYVERHDVTELEEMYTQTFDINPMSALEVGWHLFGEEYARGMFLVRMREELRKYGIPEAHELPDHLSHVLAVVAAMPDSEATRFVRACVQPAVEKMRVSLADKETPYRHVINCLSNVLQYVWGPVTSDLANLDPKAARRSPLQGDPLHAFPVADVGCSCAMDCQSATDIVLLDTVLPNKGTEIEPAAPSAARES